MNKRRIAGLVLAGATGVSTVVGPVAAAQAADPVGLIGSAFTIENKGSHKCLDARQSTLPGPVYQWACHSTDPNQNWLLEAVATQPGWFSLRNLNSNLCLDLRAGVNSPVGNGTATQQWDCFPDSIGTERWQLNVAAGVPGYLTILSQSGKCLDLDSGSTADGAKVQVWDCRGNVDNQLWRQG